MTIEFDPAKDYSNIAKHGVSLALAEQLDWDAALIWQDIRQDYGEVRLTGLAFLDKRLYAVVFVERERCRRVISLRKADPREVYFYDQLY